VYLARFFIEGSKLAEILGVQNIFGWPTPLQLFYSEFSSTEGAGLNLRFIWSGVFGYLYADIGWWALLYLFIAGLLAGRLWEGFNAGGVVSVLLYLWMAFWVVYWVGWNLLLDGRAIPIIEVAALLFLYERAFVRRVRVDHSTDMDQSRGD
jgi:hypothetical protein